MSIEQFDFPNTPIPPQPRGTSLLVEGPSHGGTRDLSYRMVDPGANEGQVIVASNDGPRHVHRDCEELGLTLSPERTAILDCLGEAPNGVPARVYPVASQTDLTGMTMYLSKARQRFQQDSIDQIRLGVVSVSPLLTLCNTGSVLRFISTLVGRINNLGWLGVFLVNPKSHDERLVEALSEFTHRRVQVRLNDDRSEVRTLGSTGHTDRWNEWQRGGRGD